MAWGHGPGGTSLMGTRGRAVLVTEEFGTHPFAPPERTASVDKPIRSATFAYAMIPCPIVLVAGLRQRSRLARRAA